ncbi:uncharacterized protein [Argopecten irradians]|uniref:uncharacterized protein isoform X1 n=1 Tax=Argopecten irradians TaxID=31199 RepID=UPI00370FF0B7
MEFKTRNLKRIFGFLVTVITCVLPSVNAEITCSACSGATSIADCSSTSICGNGEYCYWEEVTNEDLSVAFNAGCRSTAVCDIMSSLNAGKRAIVNCAQCCNSSSQSLPCNRYLCGQQPDLTAPVVQCQQCPHPVSTVADCTHVVNCGPSELCYSDIYMFGGSILRYMRGCREKSLCQNGTASHQAGHLPRRSELNLCSECCDGDKCNLTGCYQLQHK